MKSVSHLKYLLLLLLGLGLVAGPALRAEDTPATAAPDKPAASAEATKTPEAKPADAAVPAEQVAAPAESNPPPPVAPAAEAKPAEAAAPAAESNPPPAVAPAAESSETKPAAPARHRRHGGRSANEKFTFGGNSTLAAGESADAVISILGSSTSAGEVGDAVVSVMGSSRMTGGTVGDSVVSVLGDSYVNGHVRGQVVAVLGNVELGPDAVVDGDIVCVGGEYKHDPNAVHHGNVQNVAIAGHHFNFGALSAWFEKCVLYARPLAFDARLWWAWTIALAFLGFYTLVALMAPTGVNKCVETLEQRPGSSLLSALLTLLLTPVAFILLSLTLVIAIGVVLIPALSLGLFCAALFGKVVMLAWLGRRITKLAGEGVWSHPVFGVLIGGVIVLLLYTVPIAGFVVYKLLGILGLGVVVYTLIRVSQASRPPKPATVPGAMPMAAAAPLATPVVPAAPGAPEAVPPVMPGESAPAVAPLAALPPVISAVTLPRAGFWIRVGAAFLDFIMVFVGGVILLKGILHLGLGPGIIFLAWIVYHPVMWKLKGTTIGGIICNLKVVRVDDRPIDWGVAIVRAFTAFMSFIACGLGFIWVAFDDEKQSWHDKVAGTTIVRVPKGTPLL
ncbi:MAG TPA: RDD family protein [Lacunisphaera sp.]|nr:RDD family protein [Lacunisphaera sp.]